MAAMSSFPAPCFTMKPDAPARNASAASSALACIVKTITLTGTVSVLSRRRTSSPFRPGMVMSVTMTSGRSVRAVSRRRAPSDTVPTRVNSSRRRLESPSSTMAWSSASKTVRRRVADLVCTGALHLITRQRHHHDDLGASLWLGVDGELSANDTNTLVETDQAGPALTLCLLEGESAPVVTNPQLDITRVARHVHPDVSRLRMPGGILQGFLRDAVEAQRDIGREGAQVVVRVARHRKTMFALELTAVAAQSDCQTRVLQNAGMKLVRQTPDRLRHLDGAGLEPCQLMAP